MFRVSREKVLAWKWFLLRNNNDNSNEDFENDLHLLLIKNVV